MTMRPTIVAHVRAGSKAIPQGSTQAPPNRVCWPQSAAEPGKLVRQHGLLCVVVGPIGSSDLDKHLLERFIEPQFFRWLATGGRLKQLGNEQPLL